MLVRHCTDRVLVTMMEMMFMTVMTIKMMMIMMPMITMRMVMLMMTHWSLNHSSKFSKARPTNDSQCWSVPACLCFYLQG